MMWEVWKRLDIQPVNPRNKKWRIRNDTTGSMKNVNRLNFFSLYTSKIYCWDELHTIRFSEFEGSMSGVRLASLSFDVQYEGSSRFMSRLVLPISTSTITVLIPNSIKPQYSRRLHRILYCLSHLCLYPVSYAFVPNEIFFRGIPHSSTFAFFPLFCVPWFELNSVSSVVTSTSTLEKEKTRHHL